MISKIIASQTDLIDRIQHSRLPRDLTRTWTYDQANRLTSGGVSGGATNTLTYDPLSRLFSITGTGAGSYLYDGSEIAGVVQNGTTTMVNRVIRGPGTDETVAVHPVTGQPTYTLLDPQNSTIALTGPTGAIQNRLAYDEYGVPQSTNTGRFQYTGQLWLPDARVYHYKARAYHPVLGRFLQPDPIGYGDGMNLYAYVGGDPVNETDPTGMCVPSRLDVDAGSVCQGSGIITIQFTHAPASGDGVGGGGGGGGGGQAAAGTTAGQAPGRRITLSFSRRGAARFLAALAESANYRSQGYVYVYRAWGGPAGEYGGPNCDGGGSCWSTDNIPSVSGWNIERARDRYSLPPEFNSMEFLSAGWVHRDNVITSRPADSDFGYNGGGNETSIRNPQINIIINMSRQKIGWGCGGLPICW